MAAQEVERSSGKQRRSIFSGKLRTITIILAVIFGLAGLIFWIIAINNDNTHIDKIMGAIFSFLVFVCALVTIPFLVSSEESHQFPAITAAQAHEAATPPQTPPSANPANNTAPDGQNTTPHTTPQPAQQPPAGNAPGIHEPIPPAAQGVPTPSVPMDGPISIDRIDLLDKLRKCNQGTFSLIVDYLNPPDGIFSSVQAPQTMRAGELLRWAENDGPGIEAVYQYYKRATDTGKKKSL